MAKKVTEKQHQEAFSTLRAEYYQHIKSMGDDQLERAKDGEFEDEAAFWEDLEQTVDGSGWTFITHQAFQVAFVSDNSDAYEDLGMDLDFAQGLNGAMTQVAYWAQLADAREYIESTLSVDYDGADLEDLIEDARG